MLDDRRIERLRSERDRLRRALQHVIHSGSMADPDDLDQMLLVHRKLREVERRLSLAEVRQAPLVMRRKVDRP